MQSAVGAVPSRLRCGSSSTDSNVVLGTVTGAFEHFRALRYAWPAPSPLSLHTVCNFATEPVHGEDRRRFSRTSCSVTLRHAMLCTSMSETAPFVRLSDQYPGSADLQHLVEILAMLVWLNPVAIQPLLSGVRWSTNPKTSGEQGSAEHGSTQRCVLWPMLRLVGPCGIVEQIAFAKTKMLSKPHFAGPLRSKSFA